MERKEERVMARQSIFNLNSVKQGQVLNANAAKGRSKAENPDAAGVFASLMGSNYSTNFNMPSVNTKINNNVLQQTNAADNYDRYQYQDNTIRQAAGDVVTDVIGNSTDALDQFQGDVVRTVAEQLGVSEDSVKDMMESLGLTAFDLLNPENLAQLAMQLTGETSPMDLLMNDQFQGLMQQMDQLGGQLANELNLQPAQMEELIAQMDILQTPETLTDEEMQVLTDVAGQQTTADTVSADVMPELAQTDEVQPMDKQADVFQKEPKSDEVRTQQPQTKETKQTYALYNLTQEQLSHTLMPVGDYDKPHIRQIAEEIGLPVATKHDSQDICFVPDHDYASFIAQETGKESMPGNFVDEEGNVMGQHRGLIHYTIGQRKGLGISSTTPIFVRELRPETNEVVLCKSESLFSHDCHVDNINYMAEEKLTEPVRAIGKIRYSHAGAPCTLYPQPDGTLLAQFDEPQRAMTPGQAAVFYQDDHVLCGGTIEKE